MADMDTDRHRWNESHGSQQQLEVHQADRNAQDDPSARRQGDEHGLRRPEGFTFFQLPFEAGRVNKPPLLNRPPSTPSNWPSNMPGKRCRSVVLASAWRARQPRSDEPAKSSSASMEITLATGMTNASRALAIKAEPNPTNVKTDVLADRDRPALADLQQTPFVSAVHCERGGLARLVTDLCRRRGFVSKLARRVAEIAGQKKTPPQGAG